MKLFNGIIVTFLLFFTAEIFATSLNGRFIVVKSDISKLSVKLQINTDSGKDDMGGATLVISFDKNVLGYSSDPVVNKDFVFHNFSGGNYNDASVTKPLSDKLWVNIILPKENNNKGTVVSGPSGWTDVVTLNFDVKSPHDTVGIHPFGTTVKWLGNNIFWQVYDADNFTNWTVGKFTDLINVPATVELLSFTAVLLDNSSIKLDWSTVTYADNAGYEIEKGLTPTPSQEEGALGSVNWEKIGFVESKNIFNTPVNYSFIAEKLPASENMK